MRIGDGAIASRLAHKNCGLADLCIENMRTALALWLGRPTWCPRGAPPAATVPPSKYYDYRRTNDGATYEEIMGLPQLLTEEEDDDAEDAGQDADETPGGWRPFDFLQRRQRRRDDGGQTHYHNLHKDEIDSGISRHLRDLGLGELELDPVELGIAPSFSLTSTEAWLSLEAHADLMKKRHLRTLMADAPRAAALTLEVGDVLLDYSRQKVTEETMALLRALAEATDVEEKISRMRRGERINTSERRGVLHTALRAPRSAIASARNVKDSALRSDLGLQVPVDEAIAASCDVRDRLFEFVDRVRRGDVASYGGEAFESALVVGIGGSYLGPEFVLRATAGAEPATAGERPLDVRFLANVDPVAFDDAVRGLDPTKTLGIVVSKSWGTAETLRNAAKVKAWIIDGHGAGEGEAGVVKAHFVACASRTASDKVERWGVDASTRLFEFWNWVGGRFSASASPGLLPLALARGSESARRFLDGAHAIDDHFFTAPLERNVPAVMALLGVWNVNFLGLGARAVVPYAESLDRFAAHVQQLEMESNGKSVTIDGKPLDFTTGEIVFGEPGTNAQHSFFQLLHCGQAVPTDFIGFALPHTNTSDDRGHDVLMANFFAQPDALAVGRSFKDVLDDALFGDGDLELSPHRTLSGDRPSLTLLFPKLDAYHVGALLALYEHRCAVQGFVWGINSFDQWGVELGKDLAKDVINHIADQDTSSPLHPSTEALIARYKAARRAGD